uniref:Ion_trans domain-containing protein n=1 Tax=Soboliphyme baturini TaxID=241478 RepID=A0A183ICM5_9BILA
LSWQCSFRKSTAEDRAEQADIAVLQAQEDCDIARICAKQFAPDFHQPGAEMVDKVRANEAAASQMAQYQFGGGDDRKAPFVNAASADRLPQSVPNVAGVEQPPATNLSTQRVPQRLPERAVPFSSMLSQSFGPSQPLAATAEGQTLVSFGVPMDGQMPPHTSGAPLATGGGGANYSHSTPRTVPVVVTVTEAPQSSLKASEADVVGDRNPSRTTAADKQRHTTTEARSTSTVIAPTVRSTLAPMDEKFHRGSSKYSLNQLLNDHFDQYAETDGRQTSGTKSREAEGGRWKDERATHDQDDSFARHDRFGDSLAFSSTSRPIHLYSNEPASDLLIRRHTRINIGIPHLSHGTESRGSLPDLMELDKTPMVMTREEIAHLSSQRRLEILRKREEEELYRRNPLLLVRLIFHPSFRAWIVRWKLALFVCWMNLVLFAIFYHLLTSSRPTRERKEDG